MPKDWAAAASVGRKETVGSTWKALWIRMLRKRAGSFVYELPLVPQSTVPAFGRFDSEIRMERFGPWSEGRFGSALRSETQREVS